MIFTSNIEAFILYSCLHQSFQIETPFLYDEGLGFGEMSPCSILFLGVRVSGAGFTTGTDVPPHLSLM